MTLVSYCADVPLCWLMIVTIIKNTIAPAKVKLTQLQTYHFPLFLKITIWDFCKIHGKNRRACHDNMNEWVTMTPSHKSRCSGSKTLYFSRNCCRLLFTHFITSERLIASPDLLLKNRWCYQTSVHPSMFSDNEWLNAVPCIFTHYVFYHFAILDWLRRVVHVFVQSSGMERK